MKLFSSAFIFIAILSIIPCLYLKAQGSVVATMKVSVTVVSGSTVTEKKPFSINIKEHGSGVGQLSFKASKYAEIELEVAKSVVLRNEYGDTVLMNLEDKFSREGYERFVDIDSSFSDGLKTLNRGHFTGALTVTITYS